MWETVRDRMIRREHNRRPDIDIEQQLQLRLKEAERLLPLPPDEEEETARAGGNRRGKSQSINLPDF
jgi:hypothetical protein